MLLQPTLSILNGVKVFLEDLSGTAGKRFGSGAVAVMDEIRRHHSVERRTLFGLSIPSLVALIATRE